MDTILLIGYKTLTQSSGIGENVKAETIRTLIEEVQKLYIENLIGTKLLNKLKDGIDNTNLTDDYKKLLEEYLYDVIIQYVLSELVYDSTYRFTSIGVVERTSENSQPVNAEELKAMYDRYRVKASAYSGRVTSFLCANKDKFPEYGTKDTSDEIKGSRQQYDTGIYLG